MSVMVKKAKETARIKGTKFFRVNSVPDTDEPVTKREVINASRHSK